MIKYIKDILTPIKPHQRLLALVFILLASIITTLGVQLIKEKNSRDVNCEERSKVKDKQLQELYVRQDSLQNLILSTKDEFNKKLISITDYYTKQIDSIITQLQERQRITQTIKKFNTVRPTDIIKLDSIKYEPIKETKIIYYNDNEFVIDRLKNIKKNINSNKNN